MDDLDPLHAIELRQATWYGMEVPQPKSGEVLRVPVAEISAMQVAPAGIDAFSFPVRNHADGCTMQWACRLPSTA